MMTINELKIQTLVIDIIETIGDIERLQERLNTKIKIYNKTRKEINEKSINNMDCQNNLYVNMEELRTNFEIKRHTDKKPKEKKSITTCPNEHV